MSFEELDARVSALESQMGSQRARTADIRGELAGLHDAAQDVRQVQREHTAVMIIHTDLLREHSSKLDEHTEILREHSSKLDAHTEILREHSSKLDAHTEILREHGGLLREILSRLDPPA